MSQHLSVRFGFVLVAMTSSTIGSSGCFDRSTAQNSGKQASNRVIRSVERLSETSGAVGQSVCTCTGTGPGGVPVTVNCGQSACGSDYITYSCSDAGWLWTGQACSGNGDAGAGTCQCTGTGPGGVPVTVNCGQSACGSDYFSYSCSASGWLWTGQACSGNSDAGAGTCQCTGTSPGGVPVTVNCGQTACGSDYFDYSCSASGWSGPGQACGGNRDAGAGTCQCTGTGPGGVPVTVTCGQSACGQDYIDYSCSVSGWTWTGQSCTGRAPADASVEAPSGSGGSGAGGTGGSGTGGTGGTGATGGSGTGGTGMGGTPVDAGSGSAPLSPTALRVDDVVNPVGIDSAPYFGWFVNDPDPNEIQTQYQILVASSQANLDASVGNMWDSGVVASGTQNHVAYAGTPLASDTKYYWKVRTWDKTSMASPYSATGTFVVGLLANADWSGAHWIKRNTSIADDYTYYRKTVTLPNKTVARATVYVTSVHKYALYVDGVLVGKGPSYHYPQYQYYNAYDITGQVTANASNLFAIFNHWFGGGQGRPASSRGVLMKAIVHYTDGTTTAVGTDSTWRQAQATSWVTGQSSRGGEGVGYIERIDARNLVPTWFSPAYDDSSWSTATDIGAHPVSPWTGTLAPDLSRIIETEMTPVSVTSLGGGKYVVDLGKVYPGVPRITFSGGTSGGAANMRGGYALTAAGEIDTTKSQSTDMSYVAVLSGASFSYEPAEYLGMRYFQFDNAPMTVTTSNFKFVERHSAMDDTRSSFTSPNSTLNAVWDLMKHSLTVGAQEEFVDTPTREKGGFLGDGAIQSTEAMPVMAERVLTRKSLNEFIQSMTQYWSSAANSGRINAVYPNNDGARDIPDYTQAYLPWVWEYYLETGDRSFLSARYSNLKDVADYVERSRSTTTGLVTNLVGGSGSYQYGIVDWPASMRFGYDMTTAVRTVINGWAYADNDIVSNIAAELGNTADRDVYRARADAIKSAINSHLLDASGVYVDGLSATGTRSTHMSQHASMFPLALGIVPSAQVASAIAQVEALDMSVGMVTVWWLVRALGEADRGPTLVDLFTNTSNLGWARCLSRGATATWESWTADTNTDSQSHAWGAAGLYGFVHYILGVTPLLPQYQQVRIKPLDFQAALASASGRVPTDRGDITVAWDRNTARFFMTVTIPVNVSAVVYVPKAGTTGPSVRVDGVDVTGTEEGGYVWVSGIGSGTHTFERVATPS